MRPDLAVRTQALTMARWFRDQWAAAPEALRSQILNLNDDPPPWVERNEITLYARYPLPDGELITKYLTEIERAWIMLHLLVDVPGALRMVELVRTMYERFPSRTLENTDVRAPFQGIIVLTTFGSA